MLPRLFVLFAALAATGWYVWGEQQAGRLRRVDELFLDLLAANTRERLTTPVPNAASQVVWVRMREEDAGEYAGWTPPPLDWQTVLKGLQAYQPSVLVVAAPLNWGRPAPDFVPAVAEALLQFPSVILGVEANLADGEGDAPAFMGELAESLPRLQNIDGPAGLAPRLGSLVAAPDVALVGQGELGLLGVNQVGKEWRLPYALREGERLAPTVLAQALSRQTRSPYALQRLRLGPGAAAYLRGGHFIPLEPSGEYVADPGRAVPTVNALNLMTGTLTDGTTDEDKAALGRGKVVVIGYDREGSSGEPSAARLNAVALESLLALPRIEEMPVWGQWLAWSAAAAAAVLLAWRTRGARALMGGLVLMFGAFAVGFFAFQSSLIWFPPTMPTALIGVGAVLGCLLGPIGRRRGEGNGGEKG